MVSGEVAELRDCLRLRQEEIDNLRDLMNGSTEEIVSLQSRLRESREISNSLNEELFPLRHKLDQVTRERDLLLVSARPVEARSPAAPTQSRVTALSSFTTNISSLSFPQNWALTLLSS